MRRAFPSVLAVLSLTGPRDCRFAILINTVAVYAYLNNCFPTRQGEVSALVNLARTLGGFACVALLPPTFPSSSLTVLYVALRRIPYYQNPWSESPSGGPMKVFGTEAGVAAALFVLIVPALQVYGRRLRARFSVNA